MDTRTLLLYLTFIFLAGCVPSLHPLYTEKDAFFEQKLLGCWTDGKDTWKFQKAADPNAYSLTMTKKGDLGKFDAHLVKIENMIFMDLFPQKPDLKTNDFYKLHLLPAHTFIKVEQIEPKLTLSVMDPETIKEMLENDPNIIKHEILDDKRIVLTASTKELQDFLKEHADDKGLFGEPAEMERCIQDDPNIPEKFESQ